MSPFLFLVPSTLKTGRGFSNLLMGKCISLVYRILRKFSVAPESRSAIVLALFLARWMNRRSYIDFRIDKYILSEPVLLIQAAQIRPPKNPLLLPPSYSLVPLGRLWRATSIAGGGSPHLWLPVRFHYLRGSSRSIGSCVRWRDSV